MSRVFEGDEEDEAGRMHLLRTSQPFETEHLDQLDKKALNGDIDHSTITGDSTLSVEDHDVVQEDQSRNLITAYLNHSRPLHICRYVHLISYY